MTPEIPPSYAATAAAATSATTICMRTLAIYTDRVNRMATVRTNRERAWAGDRRAAAGYRHEHAVHVSRLRKQVPLGPCPGCASARPGDRGVRRGRLAESF